MKLNNHLIKQLLELAIAEDIGSGDVTSESTISDDCVATGIILSKDTGVLTGLGIIEILLEMVDSQLSLTKVLSDGDLIKPEIEIGRIHGPGKTMLTAERTALNFLQHLSGIATMTAQFVSAVADYPTKIIDTRKTTPGWRILEKYAVRVGGGYNHRFGLYDGVLIKDNHIALAGSVAKAIKMARATVPHTIQIEIEVENLQQVEEALRANADIILLDNMALDEIRASVELIDGRALVEASGGVRLDTVKQIAATGVDLISVGALTHSAPSLDISIEITAGIAPN